MLADKCDVEYEKENGRNLTVKLPPKSGNRVHKALYQQRVFFKPGRIARIGQSLKITEGILNGRKNPRRFRSEDVDLLAKHPLEKLTIVNMTGNPEHPFEEDFTKILKKNNHTLKSLAIYQDRLGFKSDWILTIHRYARELTEFEFHEPEMTNEKLLFFVKILKNLYILFFFDLQLSNKPYSLI